MLTKYKSLSLVYLVLNYYLHILYNRNEHIEFLFLDHLIEILGHDKYTESHNSCLFLECTSNSTNSRIRFVSI